jgi:hypothetical protein
MTSDERPQEGVGYEPPEVEELPAEDGPAVTAAGDSPAQDSPPGVEWQPRDEREEAADER